MSIVWGIKKSFRDYLEHVPDATVLTAAGAERRPDGTWTFAESTHRQIHTSRVRITSSGTVTIQGHAGQLSVTVDGLQIDLDGRQATISTTEHGRELTIAKADIPDDPGEATGPLTIRPRITTLGSAWLGGVYPPGTELDPMTVAAPECHQ